MRQLAREPLATGVAYAALYEPPSYRSSSFGEPGPPALHSIGNHSISGGSFKYPMGLSAWKQYGASRWALRVNPSSGNLHPTEAWIVRDGRVCHYAPREHALEERCVLAPRTSQIRAADHILNDERRGPFLGSPKPRSGEGGGSAEYFLVALTSITWREAWKYGERAFRYCQHDTGHAIGALRFAAAMLGWRMHLLPHWSDAQVATLLGLDRDADYDDAEREEPECIALVTSLPGSGIGDPGSDVESLLARARQGAWSGRANRLSSDHVQWPIIEEVTSATRFLGIRDPGPGIRNADDEQPPVSGSRIPDPGSRQGAPKARDIILQRRSALAFNPRGALQRDTFLSMLGRLHTLTSPWDVIDWPPHVHLVLYVHRVHGMTPGIYAYLRDAKVIDEWKPAMRSDFLWEPVNQNPNLFLLVPIDAGPTANRLSCDQEIAEDGFFSLSMLARFDAPLRERGESFYRRLFWECGLIGQVLYLEAEAAGARATGIGCYYDEPVHELLGLSGHAWQSLYHFSMGLPVEDTRLTSEPGYLWER